MCPELTVCRRLALTGEPCLFCGLTRDALTLLHSGRLQDPPNNPRAMLFFTVFAAEGLFRAVSLLPLRRLGIRARLAADAGFHCALAAFAVLNWN
mgnify:CR=1 FL=1